MHNFVKWVLILLMTLGLIVLFLLPTPENIHAPTPLEAPAPGESLYTPPAVDEEVLRATREAEAAADALHQRMLSQVQEATADAAAALQARDDAHTGAVADAADYDGSDTLSTGVQMAISAAQDHLMNSRWEAGVNELNAIYGQYADLSHFEQRTLLGFYANALLGLRMHDEAVVLYEQLLGVPAPAGGDENSRPHLVLGQLYAARDEHHAAVQHFSAWLRAFGESGQMAGATESVLVMLADSYVSLEQYDLARPALEAHIRMREAEGLPIQPEVQALRQQLQGL